MSKPCERVGTVAMAVSRQSCVDVSSTVAMDFARQSYAGVSDGS